jgi:hypothetical protein
MTPDSDSGGVAWCAPACVDLPGNLKDHYYYNDH